MTKKLQNKVTNVAEYLRLRDERKNLLGRYANGELRIFYNKFWLSKSDFDRKYPIPTLKKSNFKGENQCKKVSANLG